MATAAEPRTTRALQGEQRVLLPAVGWGGYEALLRMVGDGHVRITYDRGDVELMSPSSRHESYAKLLARIIETVTLELDIPCSGLKSTTWRRMTKDKGLEADECYYLASLPRVAGKMELDLTVDPPPDLAIEVEISRSALDRLAVYAGLGVPEVWRFDGESLTIERLRQGGTYESVPVSPSLPVITPEEIVRWVREADSAPSQTDWGRRLRDWVREELAPRLRDNTVE